MKKKIFSLLLGICLIFGGLFSFSGCSIYTKDEDKANAEIVMRIGETDVSRSDLYSAFYTYYQNNSTYFAYYSQDVIEESFYTWFTVKTLVSELSKKNLYDKTSNPNGYIFYTSDDADEVWESVEDYFYSQISSYEKLIYQAEGIDEEDYPEWLQSEDEDEEETKFEFYTSSTKDVEEELKKDRKSNVVSKLTEKEVYGKVDALISTLFKYQVGDDETKKDMGEKGDDVYYRRNQAYTRYVELLKLSAKANSDKSSVKELLKAEVLRIYNAYYESQISVIFQNYYMEDYLFNKNDAGDKTSLSDRAVVAKFLDAYYQDKQVNKDYSAYVATMEPEDSSSGASLVLYHHEGKYYYFSVQHILLSFSDDLLNEIEEKLEEISDSEDEDEATQYTDERNQIAENNKLAILVEIDEAREKNTLVSVCDYYYYDEEKKDVYDADKNIFNGYVKLTTHSVSNGEITYTDVPYTNSKDVQITKDSEGVGIKRMANINDVLEAYKETYKLWISYATDVFNGTKSIDDICKANDNKLEDLRYVLEVAENYKNNGFELADLKNKIASLAFIELEWIYSGDSLDNEISNKIGYICSSFADNNINWVVEFSDGAKQIIEDMKSSDYNGLSEEEKILYTGTYVTDYGYHIIKLENIYDAEHSSIVNLKNVNANYSLAENSDYVKEVAGLLNKTYVCSSSNQTLYDYYRDEVYTALAGTSSSSGSYFLGLEYEWLETYYDDDMIEIITQLGYDDLVDSLS